MEIMLLFVVNETKIIELNLCSSVTLYVCCKGRHIVETSSCELP